MKKTFLIVNFLVATFLTTYAQGPQVVPSDSTKLDTESASPALTFSGFIDTYYAYDFSNPKSGNNPLGYAGTPANTRPAWVYNHNKVNEFNINLAMIRALYSTKNVRGALSLQVGTYPQYNYAAEQGMLKNVYEASVGIKLVEGIWLDAGIFPSHIGLESAISKDNMTLTRSMIADNTPYYESGTKLTIDALPTLTVTLLVVNGWQNIQETPNNTNKALGTQIQFKSNDRIVLNSSTFFGNEKPDSARQYRIHHDFYATFNLTDALSLAAIFDIGSEEKAGQSGKNWYYAPAVLARLKVTEKLALAGRLEHYNDKNGVFIPVADATGNQTKEGFQTSSASLGLNYAPAPNALLRIEGKAYHSKGNGVFVDKDGDPTKTHAVITTSLAVSF